MGDTNTNIFEGLNSEQAAAVQCITGPVLIVAGAGSGKTRVLTCRIANILAHGTPASRVMSLTFTKKAAGEMKERISMMVGEQRARRLCMGTFHAVFVRFLREYAESLGYPQSFTIYDSGDSISAIKACIKELQLDDKVYKPKEVLSRISMAKNNLFTADAYRNNPKAIMADTRAKKPRICDIYSLYAQHCKTAGVMDFDDILLNMNILLRDNKAALESISSRFSYILVDEYQDTNYSQYLILRKLSEPHHNICVVGDDSQSIYAFRGARIENILNFKKDYPECKTFRLEQNYRSTQTIVDAANSLIAHNEGRIPKRCFSRGSQGDKIEIVKAFTEREEAVLVVSRILDRMRTDSALYKDFAILYRTNAQSRALEEALRGRNIPYVIYSGNSFFDRTEVKDLMAYFKLAVNPNDDESLKRVIGKPSRGIGATSMAALELAARSEGCSLFKAMLLDGLEQYGLRGAAIAKFRAFALMINGLAMAVSTTEADEMAERIAKAHTPDSQSIYDMYKSDNSIEGQARLSNVEELLNSVTIFIEDRHEELASEADTEGHTIDETIGFPVVTLDEFLENAALLSNVDIEDDDETGNNKVSLMTVHSAKGLEYPYVFVTGMEENLFPSGGMLASPTDIEEERRLFYVAITRAGKDVTLSYAQTRMRNGQHNSNPPSRFLGEIDEQYLLNPLSKEDMEEEGTASTYGSFGSSYGRYGSSYGRSSEVHYERRRPAAVSDLVYATKPKTVTSTLLRGETPPPADPSFVPDPMTSFYEGETIVHNRFGRGRITKLSGSHPDRKANIDFEKFGQKVILLKYAKMKKAQ